MTYSIEHTMHTPEDQPNDWFQNESLKLFAATLQVQSYPNYPTQDQRLSVELVGDEVFDDFPAGPWWVKPEEQAEAHDKPLHPWLQAMIGDPAIGIVCGKGFYRQWGPNYTADPIVVRGDLDEPHVLLVKRNDGTGWALPGGFVDLEDGHNGEITAAARESHEETGIQPDLLAPQARVTYQGPVADLRSTAHAWPDTTAVLFEIPNEQLEHLDNEFKQLTWLWEDLDDHKINEVAWVPVSDLSDRLFGSHLLLIQQALAA